MLKRREDTLAEKSSGKPLRWDNVKSAVFETVFSLANNNKAGRRWVALSFVIDLLQLLSFQFPSHLPRDFSWSYSGWLQQVLYGFSIAPYISSFEKGDISAYIVGLVLFLSTLACVTAVAMVIYAKGTFAHQWILKILRPWVNIVATIGFIPLFAMQFCFGWELVAGSGFGSSSATNYGGVVIVFSSFLVLAFACIIVGTCYDPDPDSEAPLARPHSRADLYHLLCRAVLVVVSTTFASNHFVLLATSLIVSISLAYVYTWYLPYYDWVFMRGRVICTWCFAWSAFCMGMAEYQRAQDSTATLALYAASVLVAVSAYLAAKARRNMVVEREVKHFAVTIEFNRMRRPCSSLSTCRTSSMYVAAV